MGKTNSAVPVPSGMMQSETVRMLCITINARSCISKVLSLHLVRIIVDDVCPPPSIMQPLAA